MAVTTPELIPLAVVDLLIDPAADIGKGPAGHRWVAPITAMTITGERLTATLANAAAADWVTVAGRIATIDVRATVQTHDGALLYIQYGGRTDASAGVGRVPASVTVTVETGDERYAWLTVAHVIGRSEPSDLRQARYHWFEVR